MECSPVLRFQVNDGDPVGFGLTEITVSPGFRSPPGLVAPGGGRANDSGLVQFLDNAWVSWLRGGCLGRGRDDDMFRSQDSRYPINLKQDTATELLPIWNDPDNWAAKRLEGLDGLLR
jgi:hypothetical protein